MAFCKIFTNVAQEVLRALGTPHALKLKMLMDGGEWDQLALSMPDPMHYFTASDYFRDAQASALFVKNEDLDTTYDRTQVAREKWMMAEDQCRNTNVRMRRYSENGPFRASDVPFWPIFDHARKRLAQVLGKVPEWEEIHPHFGPGATTSRGGNAVTAAHKLDSTPEMSDNVPFYFVQDWRRSVWGRKTETDPLVVQASKYLTVPKNARTHRSIAVEPDVNVYYQLGIGGYLRRRLKLFGIDLNNGGSVHQTVACCASVTGAFATLDLSSASDTVARELIRALLPEDWVDLLEALRTQKCDFYKGNRDPVILEKFSSMGNGFTFELETLVFMCLIWAAADRAEYPLLFGANAWVYGDDIIVPTELSAEVSDVLMYFGFTLNREKSFVTGLFRESCGGDYFAGADVRPYFVGACPASTLEWMVLHNWLRKLGFSRAARLCLIAVPAQHRKYRGPLAAGDTVFYTPDPALWITRERTVTERSVIPLEPKGAGVMLITKVERTARYLLSWKASSPTYRLSQFKSAKTHYAYALYTAHMKSPSIWLGQTPWPEEPVDPTALALRVTRADRSERQFWQEMDSVPRIYAAPRTQSREQAFRLQFHP